MVDTWGGSWGSSWGLSWTRSGTTPPVVVTPTKRRGGPYHGAQKYFLPPGWKTKKPSIEEVKKLYVEARKEIPPNEQRGLLPARFRLEGRSIARLPPVRLVDFDSLRSDLDVLRQFFAALEAKQVRENLAQAEAREAEAREAEAQAILKRRREEDTIIWLLLN